MLQVLQEMLGRVRHAEPAYFFVRPYISQREDGKERRERKKKVEKIEKSRGGDTYPLCETAVTEDSTGDEKEKYQ